MTEEEFKVQDALGLVKDYRAWRRTIGGSDYGKPIWCANVRAVSYEQAARLALIDFTSRTVYMDPRIHTRLPEYQIIVERKCADDTAPTFEELKWTSKRFNYNLEEIKF